MKIFSQKPLGDQGIENRKFQSFEFLKTIFIHMLKNGGKGIVFLQNIPHTINYPKCCRSKKFDLTSIFGEF